MRRKVKKLQNQGLNRGAIYFIAAWITISGVAMPCCYIFAVANVSMHLTAWISSGERPHCSIFAHISLRRLGSLRT